MSNNSHSTTVGNQPRRAERRTGKEGKRGEGSGCKTVWRRPPTTSGMPKMLWDIQSHGLKDWTQTGDFGQLAIQAGMSWSSLCK